jgi:hypothetical protein
VQQNAAKLHNVATGPSTVHLRHVAQRDHPPIALQKNLHMMVGTMMG